ncbi:MAG: hypothetical protein OEM38_01890 [Gammaproteobacteria bacterium]|nr:hypothetical protein [Gammaproteobacteria bacterium]
MKVFFWFFIIISGAALGEESEPSFGEPRLERNALRIVNDVHATVSNNLISVSNYIDNFFAAKRMEEEGSKSKVVLSYLTAHDDFRGSTNEYILKVRLHFPKTEERLRLVVDSNEEEDSVAGTDTPNQAVTENRVGELMAALQYIFVRSKIWQVSANSGLRFSVPLDPFAKLRIRRLFFVDGLTLRLTESVFWFNSDGWGETTSFDVERKLNQKYFFRSSSRVTAIRDTHERSFTQSFSVFQDVGDKKIMVYTLGTNADLKLPAVVTQYYINLHFRHNFYKKWAFYELIPGITMERENSFNASPGFLVRFDVVFG